MIAVTLHRLPVHAKFARARAVWCVCDVTCVRAQQESVLHLASPRTSAREYNALPRAHARELIRACSQMILSAST